MLKDTEISRYSIRRTHRTYTPEFKAELVAACKDPGVSIAAIAGQHGMNANVLHRWLQEHQRSGRHALVARKPGGMTVHTPPAAQFIAVPLSTPATISKHEEIRVELRKGALSMVITWPTTAMADFASWTADLFK